MQAASSSSRPNLRIVLGIAGALIGCGAVAAATKPEWRAAILGRSFAAARPAAAALAPAPAPVQVTQQPLAVSRSTLMPIAAAEPKPEPAPAPTVASTVSVPGQAIPTDAVAGIGQWQVGQLPDDHDTFLDRALVAYFDAYMAGDDEACDALVRMVDHPPVRVAGLSGTPLIVGADGAYSLKLDLAGGQLAGVGGAGGTLEFVAVLGFPSDVHGALPSGIGQTLDMVISTECEGFEIGEWGEASGFWESAVPDGSAPTAGFHIFVVPQTTPATPGRP